MTTAGRETAAPALAVRCPSCGRRVADGGLCSACGSMTRVAAQPTVVAADRPVGSLRPEHALQIQTAVLPEPVTREVPVHGATHGQTISESGSLFSSSEVRGRVILASPPHQEPMDFDPWRWVAIPVWGLVLLITPLVAAIIVWQAFGLLPAVGVAACSLVVLRFIFSDRLLQSWHLTAALNGRYIVEPMPVTLVRLRLTNGREVQLRLKGRLSGGAVLEGDRIRAGGKWLNGVFHVKQAICERTGATIIPRQPCARGPALTGLCVLAATALWLYLAGVPWVIDQARSFRTSIQREAASAHKSYRRFHENSHNPSRELR